MGAKRNIHTIENKTGLELFILGISSHENDYRLSWAINNVLDAKLIKSNNHQSLNKRLGIIQEFSMYTNTPDEFIPFYKLISNRCENGFLLEDLKNIDFIFIVEESDSSNSSNLSKKIKSIPFISAVFELKFNLLKYGYRLK